MVRVEMAWVLNQSYRWARGINKVVYNSKRGLLVTLASGFLAILCPISQNLNAIDAKIYL